MSKYVLLVINILVISCENGLSPNLNNIHLQHTGNINGEYYEFMAINYSSSRVWFTGYDKDSPIYLTSFMSDTGWVSYGGWCGTGLKDVKLEKNEIIKFIARKPNNDYKWRVALLMKNNIEEEVNEIWSPTLD